MYPVIPFEPARRVREMLFEKIKLYESAGPPTSKKTLFADVKLPAVIADNMVLQQGMQVPIWGWADPGESVVVQSAAGDISRAKADKEGLPAHIARLRIACRTGM